MSTKLDVKVMLTFWRSALAVASFPPQIHFWSAQAIKSRRQASTNVIQGGKSKLCSSLQQGVAAIGVRTRKHTCGSHVDERIAAACTANVTGCCQGRKRPSPAEYQIWLAVFTTLDYFRQTRNAKLFAVFNFEPMKTIQTWLSSMLSILCTSTAKNAV